MSNFVSTSSAVVSVRMAKSDIQKGSKSFSFASVIFSRRQREACWRLYSWCRRSDDAIDNASTRDEAQKALADLRVRTSAAFRGDPTSEHPWTGLRDIAKQYSLPESVALDLLRGFEMDLGSENAIQVQMKNWDDLLDYCYCVAGTVGLLMCPIMGVKNHEAGRNAVALGSAMQLTNVARDIKEDFERRRVYLPLDELQARDIDPRKLLDSENRRAVFEVVRQMLERAEDMYALGEAGLRYLPFRAAWAVQVAATIYREIGRQVLARGAETDYRRVVIGRTKKIALFFKATVQLFENRFAKKARRRGGPMEGSLDGINIISS